MDCTDTLIGSGIFLYNTYFIYLGEDCKEYPLIDFLGYQRLFNKLSFICENPILESNIKFLSSNDWNILDLSKNKETILILADTRLNNYLDELIKICEKLDHRIGDVYIISIIGSESVIRERSQYYEDLMSKYQLLYFLIDKKEVIPPILGKVFFSLQLEYDTPTLQDFIDELEVQFFLNAENPQLD